MDCQMSAAAALQVILTGTLAGLEHVTGLRLGDHYYVIKRSQRPHFRTFDLFGMFQLLSSCITVMNIQKNIFKIHLSCGPPSNTTSSRANSLILRGTRWKCDCSESLLCSLRTIILAQVIPKQIRRPFVLQSYGEGRRFIHRRLTRKISYWKIIRPNPSILLNKFFQMFNGQSEGSLDASDFGLGLLSLSPQYFSTKSYKKKLQALPLILLRSMDFLNPVLLFC